ncbi:NlpC/P60 family protein [Silicimonas sp. MF1-12-2]|uniref:NlpC/P60 family protein n=1 Tax=Silicimonas sp. MF1-12-2 TaxID=3384793 RepID=UPI0039B3651C
MTAEAVIAEARRWIGTPYRHQASVRGAGCDCLGLLRGVWREVYGREPEEPPPYSMDWDEVARGEVLMSAACRHLNERERTKVIPGDVILFRMREDAVAKHLGICSSAQSFIHAYARHGVVESPLSAPWRRRISGIFAFPDAT